MTKPSAVALPDTPEYKALVDEMAAQATLGHKRFCLGVHEHEGGELEYEWIDWTEAFAKLRLLSGSSRGEE